MTQMTPSEAAESMSLEQLEELALKHMEDGAHTIRHRGQVEVARELRSVAFSNIQDVLFENSEGTLCLRNLNELPREVTAAIKKIKIKRDRVKGPKVIDENGDAVITHVDMTGEVVEIEMWDKGSALDKLMRHYGGYSEDNKQQAQSNATANLDMLLGAIGAQGLPQIGPSEPDELTEDDL